MDDADAADETATISGTITYGAEYATLGANAQDYAAYTPAVTVLSVTVHVDDDETPGITLSDSALGIVEGLNGATATVSYTVAHGQRDH